MSVEGTRKRKRHELNRLSPALREELSVPKYFANTPVAKWTVIGYVEALLRANPEVDWTRRSVASKLGRDIGHLKRYSTTGSYLDGAKRLLKCYKEPGPLIRKFLDSLEGVKCNIATEVVAQRMGTLIKRARFGADAVQELETTSDNEETRDPGSASSTGADADDESVSQFSVRAEPHPCRMTWAAVVGQAEKENRPHRRLSMPECVRTEVRAHVTENSVKLLQSVINNYEGSDDNTYQEFGDLAEHVLVEIGNWPVRNKCRVQDFLSHLLRAGREMRNPPVHIRRHGDEPVPWSSDFIVCTRVAAHAALAEEIQELEAGNWQPEVLERIAFATSSFRKVLMYNAVSSRPRVIVSNEYNDARGNVEGSCLRWSYLATVLKSMSALAESELKHIITSVFRKPLPPRQDLASLTYTWTRIGQKSLEDKLRFYGGKKAATLAAGVRFAGTEAYKARGARECATDPWTVPHLGNFVELFITLRTDKTTIQPALEKWDVILNALVSDADLEAARNQMHMEDMERRRVADESTSDWTAGELTATGGNDTNHENTGHYKTEVPVVSGKLRELTNHKMDTAYDMNFEKMTMQRNTTEVPATSGKLSDVTNSKMGMTAASTGAHRVNTSHKVTSVESIQTGSDALKEKDIANEKASSNEPAHVSFGRLM